MAKQTIEQKASSTILEDLHEVKVGERTFMVSPPCMGTLIKVSQLMSNMPPIDANENRLNEVLATAKDSRVIAEVCATLILGAKAIRDEERKRAKFPLLRLAKSGYAKLVDDLVYDITPSQMYEIVVQTLALMEIDDFFTLSISLKEINMVQKTRGMEKKATQFGQ